MYTDENGSSHLGIIFGHVLRAIGRIGDISIVNLMSYNFRS